MVWIRHVVRNRRREQKPKDSALPNPNEVRFANFTRPTVQHVALCVVGAGVFDSPKRNDEDVVPYIIDASAAGIAYG